VWHRLSSARRLVAVGVVGGDRLRDGGHATRLGALLLCITTAAADGHRVAADVFAGRVDRVVQPSELFVGAAGAGQLRVAFG